MRPVPSAPSLSGPPAGTEFIPLFSDSAAVPTVCSTAPTLGYSRDKLRVRRVSSSGSSGNRSDASDDPPPVIIPQDCFRSSRPVDLPASRSAVLEPGDALANRNKGATGQVPPADFLELVPVERPSVTTTPSASYDPLIDIF
jgi:hypothetical protein